MFEIFYKAPDLQFAERMLSILIQYGGKGFVRQNSVSDVDVVIENFGLLEDGDLTKRREYLSIIESETRKAILNDNFKISRGKIYETPYIDKALNFKDFIKLRGGKARIYIVRTYSNRDYRFIFRVKVESLGQLPSMEFARKEFKKRYG